MAKPTSRALYSDYCLRQLGHPVIQININNEQLSDRIDEALELFREYHYDATSREFFLYQITQDDLDNNYIPITNDVIGIVNVASPGGGTANWMSDLGQLTKGIALNVSFGSGIGGCGILGDFQTTMTDFENFKMAFMSGQQWNYHQYMSRLIIHDELTDIFEVDDYIMLEIFREIDADEFGRIWGDRWLCQYGTSLIGRQWGVNLSKYEGVQLPGGITLDGDKLYDRYNTEVLRLEEELELRYTLPHDMLIG